MKDFQLHHKTAGPAPAGFAPKPGDLVSAKFSDGEWYRAKVRKSSTVKKEAQVTFIDYGNQDTVGFKDIRLLETKFRSLPGQAHDARMRLVILMSSRVSRHRRFLSNDTLRAIPASSSWLHRRANTSPKPPIDSESFAMARSSSLTLITKRGACCICG